MKDTRKLKWPDIDIESLKDPECPRYHSDYMLAKTQMEARTHHHELYGFVAKNKSIHNWNIKNGQSQTFSEGSTQYIIRKTLADTIQRMLDGELKSQYDKASKEYCDLEYIFHNKVMWSEYRGVDMMSNLTDSYKEAFIYCFQAVRTSFEIDADNDPRIQFNKEHWSDIFIEPDCEDIRKCKVLWHRQYMSRTAVQQLLDENDECIDSTYVTDTVRYLLDHDLFGAKQYQSEKLADQLKGASSRDSVELITRYANGDDEFVTYVKGHDIVLRRTPNYDPRKEIPWNFLVLETDNDFPLGVSQVEFLLADQQFNDLHQTSAYKNLLLAMEPPVMVGGWDTNPKSYVFEPRKIWQLGNNPNNTKIEPVKIDNAILSNWAGNRESVSAAMLRNLNVMGGEIAKDAGASFSKTAPGVEAQQKEKTININQYQKRVEVFMGAWANQALCMYINCMKGKHWLTVDEDTRRKYFDRGFEDYIDGNKVLIDFDELSTDLLQFQVREGSLIKLSEDEEREKILDMIQPLTQNINGMSEENKAVIENEILLPAYRRYIELSDIDISQSLGRNLEEHEASLQLAKMQGDLDMLMQGQQQQGQQMQAMQQAMPLEQQAQIPEIPPTMLSQEPPLLGEQPVEPGGMASPSSLPLPIDNVEMPGEQVISDLDLSNI